MVVRMMPYSIETRPEGYQACPCRVASMSSGSLAGASGVTPSSEAKSCSCHVTSHRHTCHHTQGSAWISLAARPKRGAFRPFKRRQRGSKRSKRPGPRAPRRGCGAPGDAPGRCHPPPRFVEAPSRPRRPRGAGAPGAGRTAGRGRRSRRRLGGREHQRRERNNIIYI